MIIGSNILFYKTLRSTNVTAALLIKEREMAEGTIVYTDFQTDGKGCQGNRWESDEGKNLIFSIILYPVSVDINGQFLIAMAISLGICDFCKKYLSNVSIKWPNDIYIDNNKIAGLLIENYIQGKLIESTVAGIGININQEKFPPAIPDAVSFKILTGKEYDLLSFMHELLSELDIRYKQLLYGDREIIRNEYISMLYRSGSWYSYETGGIIFKGKIGGISTSGKLLVEMEDNSIREFSFKEIEYIK